MHPLIAFLSFIFSPSQDWMLRQAFELMLDPAEVPAVVESYDGLSRRYPSIAQLPDKSFLSLDHAAMALWGEVLKGNGHDEEALRVWSGLIKDKNLNPALGDDLHLRLGELRLAQGDIEGARTHLESLAKKPGHRQGDAQIDLLACEMAAGDLAAAHARLAFLNQNMDLSASQRAAFPLGLIALADQRHEEALTHFKTMGRDPRGLYFSGLAARHLKRPAEALAQWQELRKSHPQTAWMERADLQISETYFALGDDSLSRVACERALAARPEGRLKDQFSFRIATIDMRAKRYDEALARLTPLMQNPDLSGRASIVLAEGLVKAGKTADYARLTGAGRRKKDSAESIYQIAWAHLQDKSFEKALGTSDRGLSHHYDTQYTPRLLLLQGAAFEHLGKTAEALATYQTIIDRFPKSACGIL